MRIVPTSVYGTVCAAAGLADLNLTAVGKGSCTSEEVGAEAACDATWEERDVTNCYPPYHTIMGKLHTADGRRCVGELDLEHVACWCESHVIHVVASVGIELDAFDELPVYPNGLA